MEKNKYKKIIKPIILSIVLAFIMLYIALGLVFFLAEEGKSPLPTPFILLIAALLFIIFSVFYESIGKGGQKSLLKGLFLSICTTCSVVAIVGGVIFTMEGKIMELGIDLTVSALAICMIVSMTFLSLLRRSA